MYARWMMVTIGPLSMADLAMPLRAIAGAGAGDFACAFPHRYYSMWTNCTGKSQQRQPQPGDGRG